jgi:mRNA-degrading endonuclease RelE of RelBE toxin-antitoxin system
LPPNKVVRHHTAQNQQTSRSNPKNPYPTISNFGYKFIIGPLLDNPHRVGKRLRPPLQDRHSARRGTYRVIYRIDDERQQVTVVGVFSRAGAYRAN